MALALVWSVPAPALAQPATPEPSAAQPAASQPAGAQPAQAPPAPAPAPVEAGAPQPGPAAPAADHAAPAAAADAGHAPAQPAGDGHAAAEGHESAEAHEESPWGLIARIFNFAVLVGLFAYFLRSPLAQHLATRKQQIASDLVAARETTERARRQMAEVDRRLKELPAELEALKVAGAEEVAAEAARIRQAAETERQRLLDQTRRDIEMQVRIAKQALAEHTADLAVQLAKDRLAESITPDDQDRFVDKYVSQVKEFHG